MQGRGGERWESRRLSQGEFKRAHLWRSVHVLGLLAEWPGLQQVQNVSFHQEATGMDFHVMQHEKEDAQGFEDNLFKLPSPGPLSSVVDWRDWPNSARFEDRTRKPPSTPSTFFFEHRTAEIWTGGLVWGFGGLTIRASCRESVQVSRSLVALVCFAWDLGLFEGNPKALNWDTQGFGAFCSGFPLGLLEKIGLAKPPF